MVDEPILFHNYDFVVFKEEFENFIIITNIGDNRDYTNRWLLLIGIYALTMAH